MLLNAERRPAIVYAPTRKQAATLAKKYIEEAAPEIDVVALEQKVSGEIAGVPVVGYIDTQGRTVAVRSKFAGWMMGLLVHEGERVREGQPIAWLRAL